MTVRWLAAGEAEVPAANDWLSPREAERLDAMRYTKRREESRLGRWTAKAAVARARGVDPGAVTIVNAADGAPEAFVAGAPAGVAISMTDRAGWAVCMVSVDGAAVGCDLELVEPRSDRFVHDYFTAAEREALASMDGARDVGANLIWSAKESALKVLRTGLRRDTRSVEVSLEVGGGDWSPLRVTAVEGGVYPGWWARFGEFVLTMAATAAVPPPESMVEPPPLATAAPAHSWMAAPIRKNGDP